MEERVAKFLFFIYVSLQNQKAEAADSEKAALIVHRQAVLEMLRSAGYRVIAKVPSIPSPEIETKLYLIKAGDRTPLVEENIITRLSPENLQKIKATEHPMSPPTLSNGVLLHFSRFVNVFQRGTEGGIANYIEKTAMLEAQEQALQEIKLLGWEINMRYIINYDASSAQEGTPVTFTFSLLPLGRSNETPSAVKEVVLRLSEKEINYLLGRPLANPREDHEENEENEQ